MRARSSIISIPVFHPIFQQRQFMSEESRNRRDDLPLDPGKEPDVFSGFFGAANPLSLGQQAFDYWIDAAQRILLSIDVLRQRSNASLAYEGAAAPSVLHFQHEMILDGRTLVHPVNYQLLHIFPPRGVVTDPKKRPFIVFDPRAGQGPGIGGMKEDSEIGKALKAGHPCYFVGFLPTPVSGQTVEHVCEAEAVFIARVIQLYPEAEKPCLIGNCQAGWQLAIVGAVHPELVGVLILAASPISFWAGVRGKNPMRYVGGISGGSWTVALSSDLGNGCFDGAHLVDSFETSNPANTYWKKPYNLYAKIDTEAPRFLEFEKWWGSPVLLDKNEIQFISDELFVGNRLSAARLRTSDGLRIDMRNIKAPILIFCSQGDEVTPPPQALGWITDLYRTDNEIITSGQTIIYCLHEDIGHLGIFVSSSVVSKEHDKFIQNIDMIETLPPGLYEALITDKTVQTDHAGLASGNHVLRFETRRLDDIRKIGVNSAEDDRCFLTAKRASDNVVSLYENYLSPLVRSISNEQSAEFLRQTHPVRIRNNMFSDSNPLMAWIGNFAGTVKENRKPVPSDNVFWALQEKMSDAIVAGLEAYREARDTFAEHMFFEIYGAQFMQSVLGLRHKNVYAKTVGRDLDRERDIQRRMRELLDLAMKGGLPEALARALLYVVRGGGGFDERESRMLKQLCDASTTLPKMSHSEFKALFRLQHEILMLDEANAMQTMSKLLDNATDAAIQETLSAIHTVIRSSGNFSEEEKRRLQQLEKYFVPSHTSPRRRATDVGVIDMCLWPINGPDK
jgi:hypothetical protein